MARIESFDSLKFEANGAVRDRFEKRNSFAEPESAAIDQTAEQESEQEMSAALKAFKAASKSEENRMADSTDGEFWTCVVFQSKAQRDEFWRKLKGQRLLDDAYIDGIMLARLLGIELETPVQPVPRQRSFGRFPNLCE